MALSAVGWTALTFYTLQIDIDLLLLGLSFLFTWGFYSIDRMRTSEADLINNGERVKWYQNHFQFFRKLIFISIAPIIFILIARPVIIIPAIISSVPCIFYAQKIRFNEAHFSLKDLPGLKVALVALLWVILTVIFPSINSFGYDITSIKIFYLSGTVGCFVMFQININDIRDIKGDTQENTKSFAAMLGSKKSGGIGVLFLCLGYYFGTQLYGYTALVAFVFFMLIIQLSYTRKQDFFWRMFIELQGLLAFVMLTFC